MVLGRHLQVAQQLAVQRAVAKAHAVAGQAGGLEPVEEHRDHLGLALGPLDSQQLDAGL